MDGFFAGVKDTTSKTFAVAQFTTRWQQLLRLVVLEAEIGTRKPP